MSESAQQLIADLENRGIRLLADGGRLILDAPKGALTPQEVERIRAHKAGIMALLTRPGRHDHDGRHGDPAAEALTRLDRLRCYTLPTGRMPVVRALGERLAPFARAIDPAAILSALRDFERELVALGGAPDRELAEAAAMVEAVFPSSRLVEIRKLQ